MAKAVPYLSEDQIESDSAALLAEFARARGVVITPPIPIEDIVEKYLKLGVEFDDTHGIFGVPRSGHDPDILGAMYFNEARIVIDASLDPEENPGVEGRYRFTLAHEGGGHWRLHRQLFASDPAQAVLLDGPEARPVICRSSQAKERVEWQADFYASCLLMPKKLVFEAWNRRFGNYEPCIFDPAKHGAAAVQRSSWSGPRSIGEVLRKIAQPESAAFFDQVAKHFAPIFCVSSQAMRIRLEKLGLLLHEVPKQRSLTRGT